MTAAFAGRVVLYVIGYLLAMWALVAWLASSVDAMEWDDDEIEALIALDPARGSVGTGSEERGNNASHVR